MYGRKKMNRKRRKKALWGKQRFFAFWARKDWARESLRLASIPTRNDLLLLFFSCISHATVIMNWASSKVLCLRYDFRDYYCYYVYYYTIVVRTHGLIYSYFSFFFLFRPCLLLASQKSLISSVLDQSMAVLIKMSEEEGTYQKITLFSLIHLFIFSL